MSTSCSMVIIRTRCTMNNTCVSHVLFHGLITSSYLNYFKESWSSDCFVMRRLWVGWKLDSCGNSYFISLTVWSRQTNSPTSNVIRFRNEKEHTRHNQLSSHVDLRITFLITSSRSERLQFIYIPKQKWQTRQYTSREFPYSYLAMVGACPRTHLERSHVQSEI